MTKKLLTVFGATGQQGGAIVQHVLEVPQLASLFALRGITRDGAKPAAQLLASKGVEMIEADIDHPPSLAKAVAGSAVVFAVTNFWETGDPAVETTQGKAIADAAVAAGVGQLIWSSLPSISKMATANGVGIVAAPHHFESKALVEEYIRALDVDMKRTFFMAGWYMQNHLEAQKGMRPQQDTYIFALSWPATTQLPLIDIRDTGKFIAPALLDPEGFHGRSLTCATAYYDMNEMARGWSRVTGRKVVYHQVDINESLAHMPKEQRVQLAGSLASLEDVGYFGPGGQRDLEWTLGHVTANLRTWEEFIIDNEPWF
ncbi:hypothetical protein Micbo1qcDRAFT_224866 [Microdochium bolleyi]|uniref:NmrA-like domain-containing protein n=1 Tax=Microdochium bolleyi TaxID=196109 RepID=A0A136IJF7_9PEZI|nr:hypothetical protein Micbo1qcDRAFT_224866 [Microdochium bolleyi]